MNTIKVTRTLPSGETITESWPQFVWDNLPYNEDGTKGDIHLGWRLDKPQELKPTPKASK